jgi:4-hydroxy-tetrahydrodipicolinate synthase
MPAKKQPVNSQRSLNGVVVATVLPFGSDGLIDWTSYLQLLDYCASPDGITAVFVNGHAGEGASLSPVERTEVITRTRAHIGGKKLLAGIIAYSTTEAVTQAKEAQSAGADCAVLFPLPGLAGGATATPRAPFAYVKAVAESIAIPVSIFQYPLASGLGFTTETLLEIAKLPGVVAIKEGSDTMLAYEENWRRIKAARPDLSILPSNFNWFLAQLAVGGDGILSGLASLTPHWLIDLWHASEASDLNAMRAASDRLYPIVRSIYGAEPLVDMHTRIKVGLKKLGIIANATPRPPLMPALPEIAASVERVIESSGLAAEVVRVAA